MLLSKKTTKQREMVQTIAVPSLNFHTADRYIYISDQFFNNGSGVYHLSCYMTMVDI